MPVTENYEYEFITENLNRVHNNIEQAVAYRKSKLTMPPAPVKLIAVTKNQTVNLINAAIAAGIGAIGENRVQEATGKYPAVAEPVEWHLIGHLQTNKVKQAVPLFNLIHSVDSEHLALEINRAAGRLGKRQDILIQVNIAGEETKFGVSPREIRKMANFIAGLEHVRLGGIMHIAPFYDDPELTRPLFQEAYRLFCSLKAENIPGTNIEWLSMGMTNDYIIAIEEGANIVRIGTGIFGPRQY